MKIMSQKLLKSTGFPLHPIYQKTNKSIFSTPEGIVGYEERLNSFVVAGDPIGLEESPQDVFSEFYQWANKKKKPVCGYYFSEEFSKSVPLKRLQAGVSHFVDLKSFRLNGYKKRDIRRALNQAERSQLKWLEIPHEEKRSWLSRIHKLDSDWIKTRQGPRVHFLLSRPQVNEKSSELERWIVVMNSEANRIEAFASVLPYGTHSYYLDHMVQNPKGHSFGMDYLLSELILQLKKEGAETLSLGLSPFWGIDRPKGYERLLKLMKHNSWLYHSEGLYHYKRKFSSREEKRYILLDPKYSSLKQFMAMTKATYPQLFKVWNNDSRVVQ